MKKILAIVLCVMLVCMMTVVAFAEEAEVVGGDATLDEPPVETPDEVPDESPTEDEKTEEEVQAELTTEKIVNYLTEHLEEFSVILTMILTVFYQVRKHIELNKSIATMNNNTVSVAQNSANAIANTVSGMAGMTDMLNGYKTEMEKMLAEIRANEEEKRNMAAMLDKVNKHLETSKSANLEFSNELAELLVLANIPNSKKDELYSRHRAAVDALESAEKTEVKEDVGEEA
jgi:hypothetical protein